MTNNFSFFVVSYFSALINTFSCVPARHLCFKVESVLCPDRQYSDNIIFLHSISPVI
jgi:hypothetical protein